MAEFELYGEVNGLVHLSLTETEAKALEAIAGYGADSFLKTFYKWMGEAYLKPHEKGLRSLFDKARIEVPRISRQLDEVRAVFSGQMAAIRPDELARLREQVTRVNKIHAA